MAKKSAARKKRTIVISLCIGALLLCGLIYAFLNDHHLSWRVHNDDAVPVTLAFKWYDNAQFTGFYVAKEKGYYAERELNVRLKERDFSEQQVIDQVINGQVDFAIVNPFEVVLKVASGAQIKAVAAIYQQSPAALATLTSSNIRDVKDFAGKRLGIVNTAPQSKLMYDFLLRKHGIDPQSVEYVSVGPNQPEALINHQVDVVLLYRTNGAYELTQANQNFRLILPENSGLLFYDDILITTDELIKTNPELVQKFVTASLQGWQTASEDEEAALTYTQKYSSAHTDIWEDRYVLRESLELINQENTTMGSMNEQKWQNFINGLAQYGAIPSSFPANQLFTDSFVK